MNDDILEAIDQTREWIKREERQGRVVAAGDIDLYIRNTWPAATNDEVDHVYNQAVYYRS
jgi:hypothetical protein